MKWINKNKLNGPIVSLRGVDPYNPVWTRGGGGGASPPGGEVFTPLFLFLIFRLSSLDDSYLDCSPRGIDIMEK